MKRIWEEVQREAEIALGQKPWRLLDVRPRLQAIGSVRLLSEIAERVLGDRAETFLTEIRRWRGPEPYTAKQLSFRLAEWKSLIEPEDIESILGGQTWVMEDARTRRVHLVMRDHHTLDALLYLYDALGWLPRGPMLHLDRHSDYEPVVAWHGQANGWWSLLPFLLRPSGQEIVHPADVIYGTAVETDPAKYQPKMPGELNGAHAQVPPLFAGEDLSLEAALARADANAPDFISVDLDLFMPECQGTLAGFVLDDPRYRRRIERAPVALFVLSPQFAKGGDQVAWQVQATPEELCGTLNRARSFKRSPDTRS